MIEDNDNDDGRDNDDDNQTLEVAWHGILKIMHDIHGDANFLHSPPKKHYQEL